MLSFGTTKKKSAFKLYARAKNMDFTLANEISNQITAYDEAVKFADDDDKDTIDIYDYVDDKYRDYIEQSKEYWGVISDKKKAPSAYLLYQGNIRKEIGLIKCKSESTKKEYITCVIDGAIAENYKFLKNDILKVDVVLLIENVFKRIGIEHFDVNTLIKNVKDNKRVWDIYANGYTVGINQVEKDGSRHKCMRYKPTNISELSAFIAAIRPGFKSMYDRFERREDFKWGIPALDNLLRTKELPVSFLFFQEQVMSVLHYAGFPMDQCYGIIKAIAKKHPEKVKPLKAQFIESFKNKIMLDEFLSEEKAQEYADKVWTIINDNCGYSFNSSHAYCMALDSLYQAWQKAYYPYEFYEVNLQHFSDKGKKDKVTLLKNEMKKAFGITEGAYKFRNDNRKFTADKESHSIMPALSSLKGISYTDANKLYSLKDNHYNNFTELLVDLKALGISSTKISDKLETLIRIGYFEEFGSVEELMTTAELFFNFYGKKQINKDKCIFPDYMVTKYIDKETEKQYRFTDITPLLAEYLSTMTFKPTSTKEKLAYQLEYLGYIQMVFPKMDSSYRYVQDIDKNIATLYQLNNGDTIKIKFTKNKYFYDNEFTIGDIIKVEPFGTRHKMKPLKDESGNNILDSKGKIQWIETDAVEDVMTKWIKLK